MRQLGRILRSSAPVRPVKRVPSTLREPLRGALSGREVKRYDREPATPASVLLPLVDRGGETHVWLTRRPDTMNSHSGQVAFPGGKRDPGDESALFTALREAEEEMGFSPTDVDVFGGLDDLLTTTGYNISPFVGWLREDLPARPNPHEIARAFCVPLSAFVFTEPRPHFFRGTGITRIAPSYDVDGELVWGATARIMSGLVAVVRDVMKRAR
jgi:8-oxo-dGTP pyrophosphatase MutT (NUDIX family)